MKSIIWVYFIIISILVSTEIANAGFLYATEYYTGDIYNIDTNTNSSTLVVDLSSTSLVPVGSPTVSPLTFDSPNGDAFYLGKNRIYFSTFNFAGNPPNPSVPTSQLYFVDLSNPSVVNWAGTLNGYTSNATIYNNQYWYISHGTNLLQKVTLNAAGYVTGESTAVTVLHGEPGYLKFGDIVFDDSGTLYITGAIDNDSTGYLRYTSGMVDVTTGAFSEIGSSVYWGQIAFGPDGTLYGCSTYTGDFYTIDTSTGAMTYLFTDNHYTDLTAIPVPGALLLVGIGGGFVGIMRRKKII